MVCRQNTSVLPITHYIRSIQFYMLACRQSAGVI